MMGLILRYLISRTSAHLRASAVPTHMDIIIKTPPCSHRSRQRSWSFRHSARLRSHRSAHLDRSVSLIPMIQGRSSMMSWRGLARKGCRRALLDCLKADEVFCTRARIYRARGNGPGGSDEVCNALFDLASRSCLHDSSVLPLSSVSSFCIVSFYVFPLGGTIPWITMLLVVLLENVYTFASYDLLLVLTIEVLYLCDEWKRRLHDINLRVTISPLSLVLNAV